MMNLSEYAESLPPDVKDRYLAKIKLIGNVDPYALKQDDFNVPLDKVVKVSRQNVSHYLLMTISPYTFEEMRAYKSLDAYMHIACGRVKAIYAKKVDHTFIVRGNVLHSQRIKEKPLSPWISLASSGDILAAHCDCVAGLGEVCTHVAALLYTLTETGTLACTQKPCVWIVPKKPAEGLPFIISEIDWSPKSVPHSLASNVIPLNRMHKPTPRLSRDEVIDFLKSYKEVVDCALHGALSIFKDEDPELPIIPLLFDKGNVSKNLQDLLGIFLLVVTAEQAHHTEETSRNQSKSQVWHSLRIGRVTASIFKSVCRTRIDKPSLSLIKTICYPPIMRKTCKQITYGCSHESQALKNYIEKHSTEHEGAQLETCGFFINPDYPFFGASPDSLLKCEKCVDGIVEVKCPFCARNMTIEEAAELKAFYLKRNKDGFHLDRSHAYFYQVQMQLAIVGAKFCDFVIWSPKQIYVERIFPCHEFWLENSKKAHNFFSNVILSELRAKYFSRKPTSEKLWCYCRKPDDGETMVKCERARCKIQWFHQKCLNMKRLPKSFICNNCKS